MNIANGEINLYFLLLLNQHKQSSFFLRKSGDKKLHHTEEWTGLLVIVCRATYIRLGG